MKRNSFLILGSIISFLGFLLLGVGMVRSNIMAVVLPELATLLVGWSVPLELIVSGIGIGSNDLLVAAMKRESVSLNGEYTMLSFVLGSFMWIAGWILLAKYLQSEPKKIHVPSLAVGKPLHPKIKDFIDFHWGTLASYGLGLVLAEVAFIGLYTVLVVKGGSQSPEGQSGLSPVNAFLWAFFVAISISFIGGFIGSMNSRRLSTPEATLGLLYFGTIIPGILTAMHVVPSLMLKLGYRLKELVYLSSLLGETRPQVGYWLVFAALALALVLGLNFGFVSASSGKIDFKLSYELFISSRHVSVFRPRLILGVFGVLIFGIVPPLIILAMVSAAEKVVERTRLKKLGQIDPLLAAESQHQLKQDEQTPTAMMTALSVGGVGVGVMALIVVLSVMSGFETDLQDKILGSRSHGLVLKYAPEMPEYEDVMKKVKDVRGVTGVSPFILNEVMISSEGNISGAIIKGVDATTVGSVTNLDKDILPGGKLEWLDHPEDIKVKRFDENGLFDNRPALQPDSASRLHSFEPAKPDSALPDDFPKQKPNGELIRDLDAKTDDLKNDPMINMPEESPTEKVVLPGVIVGRELASSLKVVVGDRLNIVSPLGGELGPQGPIPKSRPFRVAGLFHSGMYEYDSKSVYIGIKEAREFFGIKGAMGLEVKVADVDNARSTMRTIVDTLDGYPYRSKDWGEMNANLFAALRLEKLVMALILSIIVIVATGLIVATVIMLVLEKRKEIAVLKALGVSDAGIVKIFLSEGLQIGVVGSILGLISGLVWCVLLEKFAFKLDPQIYYIPALPVKIIPFQIGLSVAVAVLVTFLASIYPALKAAQVEPVDGLKSE
jgi:lipoprotein-releasing system permease protein